MVAMSCGLPDVYVVCPIMRQLLSYWCPNLIWADPLHFLYLGIGRDFVRGLLALLLRGDYFDGGTYGARLDHAFQKFYSWCRKNGLRPSCPKFEVKLTMNKAFDVKLCIGWLAEEVQDLHGEQSDVIQTTAYCLARLGTCCLNKHVVVCCDLTMCYLYFVGLLLCLGLSGQWTLRGFS